MVDYDESLERLFKVLEPTQTPLILLHNNPDPDAMASGLALRFLLMERLGIKGKMAGGGIIGRAENRAMMSVLKLPIASCQQVRWEEHDAIILIDTQEGAGNNSLPAEYQATVVIDHHPGSRRQHAPFVHVDEEVGATSTILTQILEAASLLPPAEVATALLYGIKTDTSDLSRHVTQQDIDAYLWLHALADLELLATIISAREPPIYFTLLHRALESAQLIAGTFVMSDIGEISNPDMISEMADLLVRRENIEWVLVIGRQQDQLFLSLRTTLDDCDAGHVIQRAVGSLGMAGGHEQMAGGVIPCEGKSDAQINAIKKEVVKGIATSIAVDHEKLRPFIER